MFFGRIEGGKTKVDFDWECGRWTKTMEGKVKVNVDATLDVGTMGFG